MKQTEIVAMMVELADTLVDDFDVVDALTTLCERCEEVLDASAAGILLVSPEGKLEHASSSKQTMEVLELFQLQANEGPSVECYRTGRPIINLNLSDDRDHWPQFAARALAAGFNSVHCFPLRLRGRTIGALNLFREEKGAMDKVDVILAQGLADIATIAIFNYRAAIDSDALNAQLTAALESRIVIEQAKGFVAKSEGCDMEVAFARIRSYSRNNNRRLSDVAAEIVNGTTSPGDLVRLAQSAA